MAPLRCALVVICGRWLPHGDDPPKAARSEQGRCSMRRSGRRRVRPSVDEAKRSFTTEVQVRWSDCDPAGSVYYPNYFTIFETALFAFMEIFASITPAASDADRSPLVLDFIRSYTHSASGSCRRRELLASGRAARGREALSAPRCTRAARIPPPG